MGLLAAAVVACIHNKEDLDQRYGTAGLSALAPTLESITTVNSGSASDLHKVSPRLSV